MRDNNEMKTFLSVVVTLMFMYYIVYLMRH